LLVSKLSYNRHLTALSGSCRSGGQGGSNEKRVFGSKFYWTNSTTEELN